MLGLTLVSPAGLPFLLATPPTPQQGQQRAPLHLILPQGWAGLLRMTFPFTRTAPEHQSRSCTREGPYSPLPTRRF